MNRSFPWLWLLLALLLLLPSAAGRFVIDLAGGLILTLFALPFILGGLGWIGWKILQSQMVQCEVCGMSSFGNSSQCTICGSNLPNKVTSNKEREIKVPASSAIIDVSAEDIGED